MIKEPIEANVSVEENKLYLYGTVGDSWDGITLDDVKDQVNAMENKSKITLYINSYGGDAMEGIAIHNFIKNSFEQIDVHIDGIAASAASIIALCGDTLTMPTGSILMIHNPWTIALGNRQDLLKEVDTLEAVEKSYQNVYMEWFNGPEEDLIDLMDNESWLTPEEAEQFGFVTTIEEVTDSNEPEEPESNLVANLLSKYAAQTGASNGKKANDGPKNSTVDDDKGTKNNQKEKPKNQLMNNFAKMFTTLE